MVTASQRIADRYFATIFDRGAEFEVAARRRRDWRRWLVTDGFYLIGYSVGTPVAARFEPVRERRMFSKQWREVQAVTTAAGRVGDQIREWAEGLSRPEK